MSLVGLDGDLLEAYKDISALQISFVASATLLLSETVLTTHRLRRAFRGRPWGVAKVAAWANYLLPRLLHVPLCGAVLFIQWSDDACSTFGLSHAWICLLTLIGAHTALLLRVYATLDRSRLVLAALTPLMLAATATSIILPIRFNGVATPPGLPGCELRGGGETVNYAVPIFASQLAYDLCCFALIAGKYLAFKRSTGGIASPLMARLVRDQAIAFGLVGLVATANLVMIVVYARSAFGQLLTYPYVVVASIAAQRLIIHFREDADAGSLAPSTPSKLTWLGHSWRHSGSAASPEASWAPGQAAMPSTFVSLRERGAVEKTSDADADDGASVVSGRSASVASRVHVDVQTVSVAEPPAPAYSPRPRFAIARVSPPSTPLGFVEGSRIGGDDDQQKSAASLV